MNNQSLKHPQCTPTEPVTTKRNKKDTPPPVYRRGLQKCTYVILMVDKRVDVNVPLTMNLRSVNISKHKVHWCY